MVHSRATVFHGSLPETMLALMSGTLPISPERNVNHCEKYDDVWAEVDKPGQSKGIVYLACLVVKLPDGRNRNLTLAGCCSFKQALHKYIFLCYPDWSREVDKTPQTDIEAHANGYRKHLQKRVRGIETISEDRFKQLRIWLYNFDSMIKELTEAGVTPNQELRKPITCVG